MRRPSGSANKRSNRPSMRRPLGSSLRTPLSSSSSLRPLWSSVRTTLGSFFRRPLKNYLTIPLRPHIRRTPRSFAVRSFFWKTSWSFYEKNSLYYENTSLVFYEDKLCNYLRRPLLIFSRRPLGSSMRWGLLMRSFWKNPESTYIERPKENIILLNLGPLSLSLLKKNVTVPGCVWLPSTCIRHGGHREKIPFFVTLYSWKSHQSLH